MKKYQNHLFNAAIICIFFLFQFSTCKRTTGPTFIQAQVESIDLSSAVPTTTDDITTAGATKDSLARTTVFHILASASGTPAVTSVAVSGHLTWRCYSFTSNGTKVIGVENNAPLEVTNANPVGSASSTDVSIKPFIQIAKTCGNIVPPNPTGGVSGIAGDIIVTATNTAGGGDSL